MRELPTSELARILIRAATGEECGDGEIVTDLVTGYAEPGYGADDATIVFGNWNNKRYPRGDDAPLTKAERIGSRLASALEKIGAECEWLDEWHTCSECYRALRTQADSYSWTMYGAWFNDCEIVCADCMRRDVETYLEEYINDSDRAVTWIGSSELSSAGFTQWEPNNPRRYENGWHPGQDDKPAPILEEILEQFESAQVVFLIDRVQQFDMHFSAWFRLPASEDEEESEEAESAEEWNESACRMHGIEDCTAPECIGAFASEMRSNELWGGTE